MKKVNLFYICNIVTLFIFMAITLWGVLFLRSGNEMGYALLSFYMIIPVSSFVIAFILTKTETNLKWLYPVLFGLIGYFIPTLVFRSSWGWFAALYVAVPAILGLLIGSILRHRRN